MRRVLDTMRARPGLTALGVLGYLAITIPTHGSVLEVFAAYRDAVGLTFYHASIFVIGGVLGTAIVLPVVRGTGRKLLPWWGYASFLGVFSFWLCLGVAAEIVHYFQYGLLAIPLYALTRSALDTVVLATLFGVVDEGYQYIVLSSTWGNQYDFNDVLINLAGAALGVVWVMSAAGDDPGRRRGLVRGLRESPAALLVGVLVILTVALLTSGLLVINKFDSTHEYYLALDRGFPGAIPFWSHGDWAAKAFHELAPLPGALLVLAALVPFGALEVSQASGPGSKRLRRQVALGGLALTAAAFLVFPPMGDASADRTFEASRRAATHADRMNWFQDNKFGLLLHWAPYSVWGAVESWPIEAKDGFGRVEGFGPWEEAGRDLDLFRERYFALNEQFDPQAFNPREWARAAWQAGMRYVVFTAKHHDGFAMYDTAESDYRVTHPDTPFSRDPRADVLAGVLDAFRDYALGVGVFFSKPDWRHPDFWIPDRPKPGRGPNYDPADEPERWQRFVEFTHAQVEELMRDYGWIDLLMLDGGWIKPGRYDIDMDRLAATAQHHQPGIIIADRAVGGPHEHFLGAEWTIPDVPPDGPWEFHVPVGWQMSFDFDDHYRPMEEILGLFVETVAKGGNFTLGVGPRPDGTLPPEALDRMGNIGRWLAINGEAIYGTRRGEPYRRGEYWSSRSATATYFFVPATDDGSMPSRVDLPGLRLAEGERIEMLGTGQVPGWASTSEGVQVTLPEEIRRDPPGDWVWVLRLARPVDTSLDSP